MATNIKYDKIEIQPGERIDHLANRVLGDSTLYNEFIKINPGLDIWNPKSGQLVNIPNVE